LFGTDAVGECLTTNGLTMIIRAHQSCQYGTEEVIDDCLTVLSASNYCGQGKSGVVVFVQRNNEMEVTRFSETRNGQFRPFLPPSCFKDVPWRDPFVDEIQKLEDELILV
jgi:hypothetical protein